MGGSAGHGDADLCRGALFACRAAALFVESRCLGRDAAFGGGIAGQACVTDFDRLCVVARGVAGLPQLFDLGGDAFAGAEGLAAIERRFLSGFAARLRFDRKAAGAALGRVFEAEAFFGAGLHIVKDTVCASIGVGVTDVGVVGAFLEADRGCGADPNANVARFAGVGFVATVARIAIARRGARLALSGLAGIACAATSAVTVVGARRGAARGSARLDTLSGLAFCASIGAVGTIHIGHTVAWTLRRRGRTALVLQATDLAVRTVGTIGIAVTGDGTVGSSRFDALSALAFDAPIGAVGTVYVVGARGWTLGRSAWFGAGAVFAFCASIGAIGAVGIAHTGGRAGGGGRVGADAAGTGCFAIRAVGAVGIGGA